MNVNDLFARKKPARKQRPGGLTQIEADRIEAEFMATMEPLGQKATEYFRNFTINDQHRFWLLPSCETYRELPIEKQIYVLRYRDWFVKEISKVVLDELSFL